MAIEIYTSSPKTLLEAIRKGINDGDFDTWQVNSAGNFTQAQPPWKGQAWFHSHVRANQGLLRLGFVIGVGVPFTKTLYGIYHGRFIEMLLMHFYGQFSGAITSGQTVKGLDGVEEGKTGIWRIV